MNRISYNEYFDKVYGCFLGKCVGGTAGGPAEGRKELLDEPLNEQILHSALPNDDLDLQILWLELLEKRGAEITAREMAEEFAKKVPYGPGEYGYFIKNFECGIYPPVSGVFNNRYYVNVMGCPEDRTIELAVGHTAPFKLWVNGAFVGMSERSTWWTCENRHFLVNLRKGENTVILKCAQLTHSARYSLIPRYENGCWLQWSDIDCKIPR